MSYTKRRQLAIANNVASALNWLSGAEFAAPMSGTARVRGTGVPYFTRATTRTVKDWEAAVRNCLSGELAFEGFRRVRNLVATTSEDFTSAVWVDAYTSITKTGGQTDPFGGNKACLLTPSGTQNLLYNNVVTLPTTAGTAVYSIWLRSATGSSFDVNLFLNGSQASPNPTQQSVTVTSTWKRFSVPVVTTGTATINIGIGSTSVSGVWEAGENLYVAFAQLENTTGQSNQNPAEYVSVGDATTPANLRTYSQDFSVISAAGWSTTDITLTTNYTNNSQGLPIACRVVEGVAGTATITDGTAITGLPSGYRGTIAWEFKKNAVNDWVFIRLSDNAAGNGVRAWFNISTGAKGSTALIGSATLAGSTITDLGNGWYRCTATCTMPAGTTVLRTAFASAAGDGNTTRVNNSDYSISRAQCNYGEPRAYEAVGNVRPFHGAFVDGVKYFPTENGNTVASNVVTEATGPAIAESTLKGARINRASTNLDLSSADFTSANWTKTKCTLTAGAAMAPDGTMSMTLVTNDGTGTDVISSAASRTITADGFCTASRVFKKGTASARIGIEVTGSPLNSLHAWIDLDTGATGGLTIGTASDLFHYSEELANGCWRFTVGGKLNGGATAATVGTAASNGDLTEVLNGTYYVWGAQFENRYGSTDYIPTTSAAVTRNAEDFDYRDTPDFGAKGMMYCEVTPDWATNNLGTSSNILSLDDGTINERVIFEIAAGDARYKSQVINGGATEAAFTPATATNRTTGKLALYWTTNRANMAANGTLGTADTSCTMPTTNRVSIMKRAASTSQNMDGCIKNIYVSRNPPGDTQIASATI